jgi:hypothetical protein
MIPLRQNIMGMFKSCSEMPGYENTYFKNSSVIPLRNSVFIGHASQRIKMQLPPSNLGSK